MDIIDIIIAKKKSFTSETEKLTRQAQEAMAKANEVATKIDEAEEALSAAEEANTRAQEVAETFDSLQQDISNTVDEIVDEKIEQATSSFSTAVNQAQSAASAAQSAAENAVTEVEVIDADTNTAKIKKVRARKIGTQQAYDVMKNYTSTGSNEDGSMTQKAITTELARLNENITKASGDLGSENQGKIVIIGEDGTIISGDITEEELKEVINHQGSSSSTTESLGIIIDYENKIIERCESAISLTPGHDFDKYSMYGGRKRCNVDSLGQITAWYGDSSYRDDGSNGDVMVYQPKFYYKRIINKAINNFEGKIIKKETLLISEKNATGFKLHPRFKDTNGNELEYILLPAYEGTTYDISRNAINTTDAANIDFTNDYLMSCADVKPISGFSNDLNVTNAERLATNKGTGWHITDMGVESINQMLFMIEYGSLNGQSSLGLGISKLSSATFNNSLNTGLTKNLGNDSGEANNSSVDGERAISYRGYENIWGNTWRFVGGINIKGDNINKTATPYIANNFNYDPATLANYSSVGFNISSKSSWISAMGYGNEQYDWIYLPAECTNANSALPVGDNFWPMTDFNTNSVIGAGGMWSFDLYNGLFFYSCDRPYDYKAYSYNARLMHIPTKGAIHDSNYQNWLAKIGG